jgi:hypothetical protein
LANWRVDVTSSGETIIAFHKKFEGEVDIATILKKLKEADKLKVLGDVRFPDFSLDDDYQKRIKAALIKVDPEEANKIFNSKDSRKIK